MARHPKKVFPALTRYQLAADIERWGWSIGPYTYGHPRILEPEMAGLSIGNFCSIGSDVTIILGNHRMDLATTYPFGVLGEFWDSAPHGYEDHEGRGDVVIGHDVWFGIGSKILPGTHIGSGAVIGAGAVVRGTVPPYAIMAGNPARLVRRRFDDATIARLLDLAWWDWPEERIRTAIPLLMSENIEPLLALGAPQETPET